MIVFLFSICALAAESAIDQQYGNANECESCNIEITDGGDLECYGYQSCRDSRISVTEAVIYCSGSYSCENSSQLEMVSTNSGSVAVLLCGGLYSCSNIDLITNEIDDWYIQCGGEKSCQNSKIVQSGDNSELECYGSKSCKNTHIIMYNGSEIYLNGYSSGHNSVITINNNNNNNTNSNSDNNNNEMNIFLYGAHSGKNTSIFCDNNVACNVHCYGNACNDINSIEFLSDNSTINCDNADKSDICPNGNNNDFIYDYLDISIPNLFDIDMTTIENSLIFCETNNNTIMCEDYFECDTSTFDLTDNSNGYNNGDYLLCYTGGLSGVSSIIKFDLNGNSTVSTIRCDGRDACFKAQLSIYFNNNNNDNIDIEYIDLYASGSGSSINVNILGQFNNNNNNNNNNGDTSLVYMNLYCTGYISCYEMTIESNDSINPNNSLVIIDNLYCMASDACGGMRVDVVNNVYAFGFNALGYVSGANIYNVKNNVYCNAYLGCTDAKIYNIKDSVYVTTSDAIVDGYIRNATNVYCIGYHSCRKGTFTNVLNMHVFGDEALYDAQMFCSDENTCNIICYSNTNSNSSSCNDIVFNNCTGICNIEYIEVDINDDDDDDQASTISCYILYICVIFVSICF